MIFISNLTKLFSGEEIFSGISFLINPKGKIVKVYEKVKPEQHADEVIRDLKIFRA